MDDISMDERSSGHLPHHTDSEAGQISTHGYAATLNESSSPPSELPETDSNPTPVYVTLDDSSSSPGYVADTQDESGSGPSLWPPSTTPAMSSNIETGSSGIENLTSSSGMNTRFNTDSDSSLRRPAASHAYFRAGGSRWSGIRSWARRTATPPSQGRRFFGRDRRTRDLSDLQMGKLRLLAGIGLSSLTAR